jgi:2-polyprenyl-6-methoxyphenol hydroxylase-like FAD-dependent oxidoreductase
MGMVPLPEGKVYWFACLNAPEKDPAMAQLSLKQLANYFATYHAPIPELLASKHPDAILHHDITDLPDLPQFAHGRVLLLGDAAHATTPNMGQGACQAIEDAVILAELCAQHPDLQQAFLSFDANRKARTQGIVRQSRRIGQLAQSQNRLVMAIRDTLLRLTPVRVQQRQLEKVLNVKF